MTIAYDKLPGLDRERLLEAVEPVLRAHRVEGVELLWKTDRGGRVLELNVELMGSKLPGDGVTIDLCTEISRDLSAALDVADIIPGAYRLQVGSPGVERALYRVGDYDRFKGQLAKVKLREPLEDGRRTVQAILGGVNEAGQLKFEVEGNDWVLEFEQIEGTRLVFEWGSDKGTFAKRSKKGSGRKAPRGANSRGSQQSR